MFVGLGWQCERCALPGLPVAGQVARPPSCCFVCSFSVVYGRRLSFFFYYSDMFRFVGRSGEGCGQGWSKGWGGWALLFSFRVIRIISCVFESKFIFARRRRRRGRGRRRRVRRRRLGLGLRSQRGGLGLGLGLGLWCVWSEGGHAEGSNLGSFLSFLVSPRVAGEAIGSQRGGLWPGLG